MPTDDIYSILMGSEPEAATSSRAMADAIRSKRGSALLATGAAADPMAAYGKANEDFAKQDEGLMERAGERRLHFMPQMEAMKEKQDMLADPQTGSVLTHVGQAMAPDIAGPEFGTAKSSAKFALLPYLEKIAAMRESQKARLAMASGAGYSPAAMALLQRTLEEKGNVTGLIPRGPGAIGIMGQVLNGAAQNNPNLSLAGVGGTYESKTAALKKLQTTTAMTNAFEQTALKNLDNMMAQAQGLADLGGPFINGPLRAGMKQFAGNPRVASFEAARQTAVQEVSKVLNNAVAGGVISDSNRTEINRMLAGDMTIAQMQAVVRTLKQDMTNRHSAYGEAITGLQQELGGGAQPQQGGAPAAAPPAMDRQTLRDLYLKQK